MLKVFLWLKHFLEFFHLKVLQNHKRKLFSCPTQKKVKTQPIFEEAIFQNEYTLRYFKENLNKEKLIFLIVNSIYLAFFSINAKKTPRDQSRL